MHEKNDSTKTPLDLEAIETLATFLSARDAGDGELLASGEELARDVPALCAEVRRLRGVGGTSRHPDPECGGDVGARLHHKMLIIRGMTWTLLGEDPGELDPEGVLARCGVPFSRPRPDDHEWFEIPDEWLSAHGLDKDWEFL